MAKRAQNAPTARRARLTTLTTKMPSQKNFSLVARSVRWNRCNGDLQIDWPSTPRSLAASWSARACRSRRDAGSTASTDGRSGEAWWPRGRRRGGSYTIDVFLTVVRADRQTGRRRLPHAQLLSFAVHLESDVAETCVARRARARQANRCVLLLFSVEITTRTSDRQMIIYL